MISSAHIAALATVIGFGSASAAMSSSALPSSAQLLSHSLSAANRGIATPLKLAPSGKVGALQARITSQQNATTVWIGAGKGYTSIGAAIAAAANGDTIYVDPGVYTNDFSSINKNLIIDGIGLPHVQATELIPNGKAIFVTNGNITINNMELSGAKVADGNGAAVRAESGNLTLNKVYVHNNQDGILTTSDPTMTVAITNSEFAYNGAGDGQTHGIYANHIALLSVKNSYFHNTQVGHQIKSRAASTDIEGNYIADGATGDSSYAVDVPNGGSAVVRNNVIEKGPHEQNANFIAYGEEGAINANNNLTVANNTFVNDSGRSTTAVWNPSGVSAVVVDHNSFYLVNRQLNGAGTVTNSQNLAAPPAMTIPSNHQGVTLVTGSYGPTGDK